MKFNSGFPVGTFENLIITLLLSPSPNASAAGESFATFAKSLSGYVKRKLTKNRSSDSGLLIRHFGQASTILNT